MNRKDGWGNYSGACVTAGAPPSLLGRLVEFRGDMSPVRFQQPNGCVALISLSRKLLLKGPHLGQY